jgi:hypothetical protein
MHREREAMRSGKESRINEKAEFSDNHATKFYFQMGLGERRPKL